MIETPPGVPLPKTIQPPGGIQIQRVTPQIDCGRYPVKRTEGDLVDVTALIFRDGHETLGASVRYKQAGATRWQERPLTPPRDDEWARAVTLDNSRSRGRRLEGRGHRLA